MPAANPCIEFSILSFTLLNIKTAAAPNAVNNHVMIPAISAWIKGGKSWKKSDISYAPLYHLSSKRCIIYRTEIKFNRINYNFRY